jgi:hypothetical protein
MLLWLPLWLPLLFLPMEIRYRRQVTGDREEFLSLRVGVGVVVVAVAVAVAVAVSGGGGRGGVCTATTCFACCGRDSPLRGM